MPEYPDVVVYVERLAAKTLGRPLAQVTLGSPFVLRTADPPLASVHGQVVRGVERLGKRIVFTLGDEPLLLVIHLMIAGRLRWKVGKVNPRGPDVLAVFTFTAGGAAPPATLPQFAEGSVVFTEASKKKRASLHLVRGREALQQFDRGGIDPVAIDAASFTGRLRSERHTIKRALTDPTLFSGIGNAYSDEILFRARMSPVKLTTSMTDAEGAALHAACGAVLTEWTERLRAEVGDGFPDKVTAFRAEMDVHGRYRQPCRACGHEIQRIVHGDHETNYCAHCQTEGRLLADRALSRLLRQDWPRTLEELEERRRG